MSLALQENPPGLPDRYLLGTPKLQLDSNPISRGAYLGLPRRVPCAGIGQGGGSAESSNGNSEPHSFGEQKSARSQDSVAKSTLSSADTYEVRKRKADRDAPIGRERTQARQEERRIHPSSRINEEPITDLSSNSLTNDVLHLQDKENINPLSNPRVHEPKRQISGRSQDKRPLQTLKNSQNVPRGRKVGSLLVKQSIKVKSQVSTEVGFDSHFSQDVSAEREQMHRINLASHKVRTTEPMCFGQPHVSADSNIHAHCDSMGNPQILQMGCNYGVSSGGKIISPALQERNGVKCSSMMVCHAEVQDIKEKSGLPESCQRGAASASLKELSSSMNNLAICDSPQANEKKGSLPSCEHVEGSYSLDEKKSKENSAPSMAACQPVLALSVPSASAYSYTIRTSSAPPVTSHTVQSLEPLNQQNIQGSSKKNPISSAGCKEEVNDAKQVEKPSCARPVPAENEVMKKLSQQMPSHENLPIPEEVGKLAQHPHLQDNKCSVGETGMQPKKQGESDHFVWVNRRRYQKLKKIGRGGSSEVYKVIDRDGNIYALKRIRLKGRDYATAYGFYQEIELLTKLQGKRYIIRLIDHEVTERSLFSLHFEPSEIVRHDAYIYMVLEYGEVDLATMLQEKLKEREPGDNVDETWLRFYWRQILEAVNTVHEERIIHADLKPANFLLVRGVLKLIDFGIAKSILGDTTNIQRDAQVGTLNYMSPEAFLMNEKDEEGNVIKCGRPSDIWALGCILYQMVYGKTPFAHINALHARIQEVANPNHKINFLPVSNPHLLDIMKKCLAYKREDRLRIPELVNHPFLKPQTTQPVEAESFNPLAAMDDVTSLTSLLKGRIQSQIEAENSQDKQRSIFAKFLEQIRLFEKQMGAC